MPKEWTKSVPVTIPKNGNAIMQQFPYYCFDEQYWEADDDVRACMHACCAYCDSWLPSILCMLTQR